MQSDLYQELLELGEDHGYADRGAAHRNRARRSGSGDSYCDALEAADRAALFKTFAKVLAQRHGKMVTFMAKWSNAYPGQCGHLHHFAA